ncbi:MAG: zinc-ribbon domain-containing protein [Chloroflexi bacterium]|nr:zinc-ribbon domain-containing protein [Chloroflexota bacterium]
MTSCPHCGHPSDDPADVCPQCGAHLASGPPADAAAGLNRSREPLEHVATAPDEVLASLWKAILEEEGIRSLIKRSDLAAAMYVFPGNTECQIHVLASEAQRAREILDSLEEVDQDFEEE